MGLYPIWTQGWTCTEGRQGEDTGRRWPLRSPGERPGAHAPSQPSDKTNPAHSMILEFQPPEPGDNTFLLSNLPSLWYFVMAALRIHVVILIVILIYISLRTNDIEHLFMCLLAICISSLTNLFILFFIWPCHAACGISVPQPGIGPMPWQWKPGILSTSSPGNSLLFFIFIFFN